MVFRELSFSRLECGVHDRLQYIYPLSQAPGLWLCGIFYFPWPSRAWHRHQIEGTNGFYCLIRKTERFTISNVESQVFTPNNSRLDPGSNPGCPRDKRLSYHWTNCASPLGFKPMPDNRVINTVHTYQLVSLLVIDLFFLFSYPGALLPPGVKLVLMT